MIDQIAAFRPTPEVLADEWPTARRANVLDRVTMAADDVPTPDPRSWRSRAVRASVLAAAVSGAAATTVALLPGAAGPAQHRTTLGAPITQARTASAPSLQLLAARAAAHPAPTLGAGRYWHVVDHETQDGVTRVLEIWTGSDGSAFARHTEADGSVEYYEVPPGDGTFESPTPAYLATLPTDPDALEPFLRSHVSGSSSTDEAVFEWVLTTVSSEFAPAALRRAAILVLQDTGHVTVTSSTDSLGRPATKVSFVDAVYRPGETKTVWFDPDSAQVLEYATDDTLSGSGPCPPAPTAKVIPPGTHVPTTCTYQPDHFLGTYTDAGQVGAVPTAVRQRGVPHGGR